jgi:hypothetical protein
MASSEMLRRVALVRTDVSEESASIRVTRIGELGTTPRHNIPENAILHSHRRENLRCYKQVTVHRRS